MCSSKTGNKVAWLHPLMLTGMPRGNGLYHKVREQTAEELHDGAATARPETGGQTPNEERSKRSETKSQCCGYNTGCNGVMEEVRADGKRLQTVAPSA